MLRKDGKSAGLIEWLDLLAQKEKDSNDDEIHYGCLTWFGVCLLFIPTMGLMSLYQTLEGKNVPLIVITSLLALAVALPSLYKGVKTYREATQARFHLGRLEFAKELLHLLESDFSKFSNLSLSGDLRQLPREHRELSHAFAQPAVRSPGLRTIKREWLELQGQLKAGLELTLSVRTEQGFEVARSAARRDFEGRSLPPMDYIKSLAYQSSVRVELKSTKTLNVESPPADFLREDWGVSRSQDSPNSVCFNLEAPSSHMDFHECKFKRDSYEVLKVDPALNPELLHNSLLWALNQVP